MKKIKQTKTNQNEVRVKLTLKRKDSKEVNVSFATLTAPEDIKTESFYDKVFLSILCWRYVRSDMCFAVCSFHFCLQSPGQSPHSTHRPGEAKLQGTRSVLSGGGHTPKRPP